jgi:hypothetical protein
MNARVAIVRLARRGVETIWPCIGNVTRMRGVYALLFILINPWRRDIVHMDYVGCTKMAHANPICRWIVSETAEVPDK